MELRGVKIGDRFYKQLSKGKQVECYVVDFSETKSLTTGKIIEQKCYAKSDNYAFGESFEIPFTTVLRFKIK